MLQCFYFVISLYKSIVLSPGKQIMFDIYVSARVFLVHGNRFTSKSDPKVLSMLHKELCLESIHLLLLSIPSLCLVSIKYQSFVYCIVSLQRKGKFSVIPADI